MNMLSAMLWAWVGVSVLGVLAAALIVVEEVRSEQLAALRDAQRQRMCVAVHASPQRPASAAGVQALGSSL